MEENKYKFVFEYKHNLTTMFFGKPMMYYLNTFGLKDISTIRNKHFEKGFLQAYLVDEELDKQHLYLVYNKNFYFKEGKENLVSNWELFYDSIVKSKYFVEEVKLDINRVAFKVKFPLKWNKDFDAIIEGRYSKISNNYMSTFFSEKEFLPYHLKNKSEEAIDFYSEKFKVNKSVFDDCEIGPKMDFANELMIIENKILI